MRTPLIGDEDPLSRLAQARNAATESAAAGSDSGKAGPTEEEQDTAATSEVNVDVEKGGGGGGGGGGGDDGEEEYERECRICGGGDEDGALMNPCACTGSMSLIHADCLRKWIETRRQNNAHGHGGTSADPMRCEICHENYAIRVRDEFVCDYEHVCTCTSCGHITEGTSSSFARWTWWWAWRVLFPPKWTRRSLTAPSLLSLRQASSCFSASAAWCS